ncbi:MAG: SDR family NAD(P)-dependent oxidoreductase [Rubripirellula sp.]|nr:SDR family NAD(P)-dependent oxidoreductase [Rubripirellula sp.]
MTRTSRPVALVTGGATGVGRATAIRFAQQGHDVVVNFLGPEVDTAHETVQIIESLAVRAIPVQCDVSDNEQVVSMAAEIQKLFGRLDVLINCAGTTQFVDHADLDGLTESMWDRILAVNTKGPFLVSRACVDMLRADAGGSIVNVSSVAGISGFGSSIAYCASKGALNTMTKSLARALAPQVRVNAVCPGPIDSGWLRQGLTDEQMQSRVKSFPIPRLAQPDDIADTILFLASGTALTTGQLLVVDGGRTMG